MICPLPNSCVLPVLATIVCVAVSLSLVSGLPVSNLSDSNEYRTLCSTTLTEIINSVCNGKTKSLADVYPDSFGQRSKRFSPDEIFYNSMQNGPSHLCCQHSCSYRELRRYCATD